MGVKDGPRPEKGAPAYKRNKGAEKGVCRSVMRERGVSCQEMSAGGKAGVELASSDAIISVFFRLSPLNNHNAGTTA